MKTRLFKVKVTVLDPELGDVEEELMVDILQAMKLTLPSWVKSEIEEKQGLFYMRTKDK